MSPSHSLLECVAIHCWRLSMARPGPGVKRAKMLSADQHRAPSARPEGRADSVGRGRRDNAGLPERHIFSEREVVATENKKAVLHYPGGEFEMDIVEATLR